MKKAIIILLFTFLCALVIVTGLQAQTKTEGHMEFKGKIGKTLADSEEYWPEYVKPPKEAPNILIWLIDDMGYGHSSAFGGLTPMPTIDRLAETGLRYRNFHTTALCSPSRASIAAGRNHHRIGMGSHSLTAMGFPGYNAHPPDSAKRRARVTLRCRIRICWRRTAFSTASRLPSEATAMSRAIR